jgi:heptosyltransferase-2
VIDWDDPALVPLFADDATTPTELARRLSAFDACIAYTRQDRLVAHFERFIPTVIAHGPAPIGVHAAEWLAGPTRALGGLPPLVPADLQPTPSEEARAAAFLRDRLAPGFLALHMGSGGPAKNWPSDRFTSLARVLSGGRWLLVEGPAEDAFPLDPAADETCFRAQQLPLRVLAAVLRQARLFVGNDSGVTHLAAAAGAPTLALFGPTDPALWSPVGRRVAVVRSPTPSMPDLEAALVLGAARALWDTWLPDRLR